MRIHPGISPASYAVEEALRGSPAPVLFPLADRPWPDLVSGIAATFSDPPKLIGSRLAYLATLEELRRGPTPPFGAIVNETLFRFAEALSRFFLRLDQAAPRNGEPQLDGLNHKDTFWFATLFIAGETASPCGIIRPKETSCVDLSKAKAVGRRSSVTSWNSSVFSNYLPCVGKR